MEKETTQHVDDGTLNPEVSRPAENSKFNLAAQHDQLQRGLKSRHIQFLALGMFCHFFYYFFNHCISRLHAQFMQRNESPD